MTSVNEPPATYHNSSCQGSSEEAGAKRLLRQLLDYAPQAPSEQKAREIMLEALTKSPACFERTHLPGHFTASIWALVPRENLVLLVHHRKLGRWLQPGGHVDGSPLLLPAALRELEEETGIHTVSVVPGIFDLDVHPIPARGEMPEHLHLDVRFAVTLPFAHELCCSEESSEVAWVSTSKIRERTDEESILRMVQKSVSRFI
jgi:8-oxo-dGTP pyrophosphatase MutT (NUDIX family)